ncbi:RHS repeat protein [Sphingosinicellaceae bacterium]|nr:RHS repeat protein [Sphingosinicellaceae bacterium]
MSILFKIACVAIGVCMVTPVVAQVSLSYSYDELGRLKQANYPSGVVIKFTYDAAGRG